MADVESLKHAHGPTHVLVHDAAADATTSDARLRELGYRTEFRRDMPLFGVLGMSFCAIGILTGMSSAFQTGLFSGGPLGLFWGWNVSVPSLLECKVLIRDARYAASLCCSSRSVWRKSAALSE